MRNTSLSKTISKLFEFFIKLVENPIVVGIAFSLAIIATYFEVFARRTTISIITKDDLFNISNFIEWFGVPYGLLTALVLVNVWTQFESTDRSVDREADTIKTLYHTYQYISDEKNKKRATKILYCYVQHVKNSYKEEYTDREVKLKHKGDRLLNMIRKHIGLLVTKREERDVLTAELLRLVNKLVDDRGDRLSYSKLRMPLPVLILSFISSALWLIPFFALSFSNSFVRVVYLFGVTFVVVSLLLVIIDLDHPFTGTWRLHLQSWEELLGDIKM